MCKLCKVFKEVDEADRKIIEQTVDDSYLPGNARLWIFSILRKVMIFVAEVYPAISNMMCKEGKARLMMELTKFGIRKKDKKDKTE